MKPSHNVFLHFSERSIFVVRQLVSEYSDANALFDLNVASDLFCVLYAGPTFGLSCARSSKRLFLGFWTVSANL